jgi:adenine deaminase
MEFASETLVRQGLVQVALGRASADLVIRNACYLDVFTLSWREHQDIVVKGQRIAWVGPHGAWKGEAAEVVDAGPCRLVPGFGEAHKHIESTHLSPEWEAELDLRTGTTWVVEASHEYSNVDGPGNLEFWLRARREGSPFKIFVAPGSATPPTGFETTGGYYGYQEIREHHRDLWVPGLDEVMDWSALTKPDNPAYDRIWSNLQATWDSRGVIQGHGAGLHAPGDLSAFAAAGLAGDHECRDGAEAWEKLGRGIFLHVRPRSADQIIGYLKAKGLIDWSNLSVTTDDRSAPLALEWGLMDYNIRKVIGAGVPVEAAYAMGSYNPARHWHLEHLVGSIAPGRFADFVFIEDLPSVRVGSVYSDGRKVAEAGKTLYSVPKIAWPAAVTTTMKVKRRLLAQDFVLSAPPGRENVQAAVLRPFHFEPDFVTAVLPVAQGAAQRDPRREISKVAVIDRHRASGAIGTLFWQGLGPRTPDTAIACTVAHDHHHLWTLGSTDEAMALAANACINAGGGWAVASAGKVLAQVRFEIGGLMTARPAEALTAEMSAFDDTLDRLDWFGAPEYLGPFTPLLARAHGDRQVVKVMIFAWLTCTPWKWVLVPANAQNPSGLVNVTTGQVHPAIW